MSEIEKLDVAAVPVIPLSYDESSESTPWFSIVRLISTLCIFSGTLGAIVSSYTCYCFFEPSYQSYYRKAGYTENVMLFSGWTSALGFILNASMFLGGIGCWQKRKWARTLAVVSSWAKVVMIPIAIVANIFVYASRSIPVSMVLTSLLSREPYNSIFFNLAVAIILQNRGVRRVFELH